MAEFVFKNAYLSVNAKDLSDHVKSLTLNDGVETGDNTAMGDNVRSAMAGLLQQSVEVEFHSDWTTDKTNDVIDPLVGAAAFALIVKPNGSVTSATNPKWSGNVILSAWRPFGGAVGTTPSSSTATFIPGDGTGLVRAEAD